MQNLLHLLALLVCCCLSLASADVHVDTIGSQAPDGTENHPYRQVSAAICTAEPDETVVIQPGIYPENLLIYEPIKLISTGAAVIGNTLGISHTTIKVITQNTHLFGSQGGGKLPNFEDATRARLIAEKINQENADVVALQEVWDPSLAESIIATAAYPYSFYSRDYDDTMDFLNSGLLLLSKHVLINPSLTYYNDSADLLDCAEIAPACLLDNITAPWECLTNCAKYLDGLASKGFMQASINKNGFQLGIFITHTQAEEHNSAYEARKNQLEQLGSSIEKYFVDNPGAEVVAMGDLNVIGESQEYFQALLPNVKLYDASQNMPCSRINHSRNTCEIRNPLAEKFGACSNDQRLDYVLFSHHGRYDLMPIQVEIRKYQVTPAITADEFTSHYLSDHYGIATEFTLFR